MARVDGRSVVSNLTSLVVGALLGWVIPLVFNDPTKLETWLVLGACIVLACSVAAAISLQLSHQRFVEETIQATSVQIELLKTDTGNRANQLITSAQNIQHLTEEALKRQAELIPREDIYRIMAESIRSATSEVVVITYLMVDWDTGNRNFEPDALGTAHQDEFYDAIYKAIENPKIQYVRVWQVPHEHMSKAKELILSNTRQKRECELIDSISKTRPDRAMMVLTDQLTTASFILIDKRCLFFNIDFYDPMQKMWHSPYMLFVKDAASESFKDLQSLIVRFTTKSNDA